MTGRIRVNVTQRDLDSTVWPSNPVARAIQRHGFTAVRVAELRGLSVATWVAGDPAIHWYTMPAYAAMVVDLWRRGDFPAVRPFVFTLWSAS